MAKTYVYHKDKYYIELPRAYTVPSVGSWLLIQLSYREYNIAIEAGSFVATNLGVIKAEDLVVGLHSLAVYEGTKYITEDFNNVNNPNPPENLYVTSNSYALYSNIISISSAVAGYSVHKLVSIAESIPDPSGGLGCICPAVDPACGKEIQASSIQTSTVILP